MLEAPPSSCCLLRWIVLDCFTVALRCPVCLSLPPGRRLAATCCGPVTVPNADSSVTRRGSNPGKLDSCCQIIHPCVTPLFFFFFHFSSLIFESLLGCYCIVVVVVFYSTFSIWSHIFIMGNVTTMFSYEMRDFDDQGSQGTNKTAFLVRRVLSFFVSSQPSSWNEASSSLSPHPLHF